MKLIIAAAFMSIAAAAQAQELMIRIDDMGALHSVNVASIDTYQNGIAKSAEVLVVGAWFPEAVKMLKEKGADLLVAGNAVFGAPDPAAAFTELTELMK